MTITTTVKHSRDWRSKLQSKNPAVNQEWTALKSSTCKKETLAKKFDTTKTLGSKWEERLGPELSPPKLTVSLKKPRVKTRFCFYSSSSMSSVGCLLIMACPDLMLLQLFLLPPFSIFGRKSQNWFIHLHSVWKTVYLLLLLFENWRQNLFTFDINSWHRDLTGLLLALICMKMSNFKVLFQHCVEQDSIVISSSINCRVIP